MKHILKIYCLIMLILVDYTFYTVYRTQHYLFLIKRTTLIPEWPANALNLTAYLSPSDDTALIKPRDFCGEKTFLLIIVESSPRHSLRRQAIRMSWGNSSRFNYPDFVKLHRHLKGTYHPPLKSRLRLYSEYLTGKGASLRASVRVVFMTGRGGEHDGSSRQLREEADQYNDIIQEDFVDSYRNLTLKTVLALKHVGTRCSNTTAYVFKTDDDIFVNVPNLLHILLGGTVPAWNSSQKYPQSRLTATSKVLLGKRISRGSPIEDVGNKWYMPHYMYPDKIYPDFLAGGGYLMSMDVVQSLYQAAWHTRIVHLEDLYVTGLCALSAGVKRRHSSLFPIFKSRRLCNYKDIIVRSKPKGMSVLRVWNFVSNYSIKCP